MKGDLILVDENYAASDECLRGLLLRVFNYFRCALSGIAPHLVEVSFSLGSGVVTRLSIRLKSLTLRLEAMFVARSS